MQTLEDNKQIYLLLETDREKHQKIQNKTKQKPNPVRSKLFTDVNRKSFQPNIR